MIQETLNSAFSRALPSSLVGEGQGAGERTAPQIPTGAFISIRPSKYQAIKCASLTLLLAVVTFLSVACAFAQTRQPVAADSVAAPPVMVVVDGKVIEVECADWRRGEQVMVCLRDLEKLGWGTISAGNEGAVLFTHKTVTLTFIKGDPMGKINELSYKLPVPPYIKSGRLMVPLSFVAKALGYDYDTQYLAVATVNTQPPVKNSISGLVTYAGRGIGGIAVRAVTADLKPVKGASVQTLADGSYKITNLPDGEYAAYVYVQDNPGYYNRVSEAVKLKGGIDARMRPIPLGRIITPTIPKVGSKVTPINSRIRFEWTACPNAATYEFLIKNQQSGKEEFRAFYNAPSASINVTNLKPGTTYEVTVTAMDITKAYLGGTVGAGGVPWTFSISSAGITTQPRR